MPTNPEVLAEIKRRNAEQKRMINSGEIKVCNSANPMPQNRDGVGQKWFHEEAKVDREGMHNTRIQETDTRNIHQRLMLCPACGLRFSATFKRIVPRAE